MTAHELNPPVKHAGLVPVRLPVILGNLINKTLTTVNWDREHFRSTEAEGQENWELSPLMYPTRHVAQYPVTLPEKARTGH